MNTILIIQARYQSARLPGKVLKKIMNKELLLYMIERIKQSKEINEIFVATSTNVSDNPIYNLCKNNNIKCYRGSENNVLERFYQLSNLVNANTIIRCCGDCPLIDFNILDKALKLYKLNYSSKQQHLSMKYIKDNYSFPDGFDFEIFSFDALKEAYDYSIHTEHVSVTPFMKNNPFSYIHDNYGGLYYTIPLKTNYTNININTLQLSLDTEADFLLIDNIINNLYPIIKYFTIEDILNYLNNNPTFLTTYKDSNTNLQGKGQKLYKIAKQIIPGGTQLLSKRPEMFLPDGWPAYYQKSEGIEISTLDGVKLKDFSYMGIGCCILGYSDEDVNNAVHLSVNRGNMNTLNSPNEVKLTQLLCEIHPWAHMARYARSGGEAATIAVRIARTASKKEKIAFCGYHGWHDWYLSANLNNNSNLDSHLITGLKPAGVPNSLKNTAFPFNYNNIESLLTILNDHDIGTIIMEPQRNMDPTDNFLEKIRDICNKRNIILIFDEISSGFRLNSGGLHLKLGITPDIAVFAKAISNGYCMGAIIGKKEVMTHAEDTFISSTYWTEDIGFSAALATINKHVKLDVGKHILQLGNYFQQKLKEIAVETQICLKISGLPCFSCFTFDYPNSMAVKTLYIQKMLERNILAKNVLYLSYAHKQKDIDFYLSNIREVFTLLKKLIDTNEIEKSLNGPIAHTGFKRLN